MRPLLLSVLTLAACGGSSGPTASVTIDPMYGWSGTAEVLVHRPDATMVSRTPITSSVDVALDDGDTVTVAFMDGGYTDAISVLGVSPGDAIVIPVAPRTQPVVTKAVNLPTVTGATTWVISTPVGPKQGPYGASATIDLPTARATVPILVRIDNNGEVLDFAGDPAEPVSGPIDLGNKELSWQAVTIGATGVPAGSEVLEASLVLVGADAIWVDEMLPPGVPSQIPTGFGDAVELYASGPSGDGSVDVGSVIAGALPDHVTYDLTAPLVPQASAFVIAPEGISWILDGGGSYDAIDARLSSSMGVKFTWELVAPPSTTSIPLPQLPTDYPPHSFDTLSLHAYQRSDFSSYKDAFRFSTPLAAGTTFQQRNAGVGPPPSAATAGVRGKVTLRAGLPAHR
jgi:hypothetical protein